MAKTVTKVGRTPNGNQVLRISDTSSANSALTVSVEGFHGRRLLHVTAKYSASPTQAGVTTELDSGAGSGFDATLNTGSANAQSTSWVPQTPVFIGSDDAIKVTEPAGGSGVTASVAVYVEEGRG